MVKTRSSNLIEDMFFVLFSINLVSGILSFSMLKLPVSNLQRISIILLFILTVLMKKFTIEQMVIGISLVGITFISWKFYGATDEYLFLTLLMIGGSLLNPRKLLKLTAIITTCSLITLFLLSSKFGVITNLYFWRNGSIRYSFGMIYPLIFAALILYTVAAFSIISSSSNSNYVWAIVILLMTIITNKYNQARNDTVALIAIALLFCFNLNKIPKIKLITQIGLICVEGLGISMVFLSKLIPNATNLYYNVNSILSDRLYLQSVLFSNYSPSMFGKYIPEVGYGGQSQQVQGYFYIDSSYTRLFFMGGVLLFIIFMYIIWRLISNFIHLGLYRQAWILIIIMLSAITEDTFSKLGLNILIPVFLCNEQMIKESFVLSNNPANFPLLKGLFLSKNFKLLTTRRSMKP